MPDDPGHVVRGATEIGCLGDEGVPSVVRRDLRTVRELRVRNRWVPAPADIFEPAA